MYGKIFASMYDGSIYGQWKAIVTFQQMIALADKDGVLDMTAQALSARTSIPLNIIQEGIEILEAPDKVSRTPDEEGRRIIRLDEDRPWGWKITNYAKYREIRTAEERREYHRRYYHEKRKSKNSTKTSTDSTGAQLTQPIVEVKVEAEADKDKTLMSGKPDPKPVLQAKDLLSFLNTKTGRNYQPVQANLDLIKARLKEGFTETQIRQVIAKKTREWSADDKMESFLRPKTLFNRTNFANYAGELLTKEQVMTDG